MAPLQPTRPAATGTKPSAKTLQFDTDATGAAANPCTRVKLESVKQRMVSSSRMPPSWSFRIVLAFWDMTDYDWPDWPTTKYQILEHPL